MIKLFGHSTLTVAKVIYTLEELDQPFEYINIDLGKNEHKGEEHLLRNPLGKVPVIEHEGHIICESNAICRYLSRISDHKYYSTDPIKAYKIDQMIDFISHHIFRSVGVYFYQELIQHKLKGLPVNQEALDNIKIILEEDLPYLEKTLKTQEYLCGEEITLADMTTFPILLTREYTSFTLQGYPHIQRWYDQMKARPAHGGLMQIFDQGYRV